MQLSVVDDKIGTSSFLKMIRPMELDLIAVFKLIEEDIQKLVIQAQKEEWELEKLMSEIDLIFDRELE